MEEIQLGIDRYMLQRILSSEIKNYIGNKILVKGWLHSINYGHILIRDRHGLIKVRSDGIVGEVGSILSVIGTVSKNCIIIDTQITVEVTVTYPSFIDLNKDVDHSPRHIDNLLKNKVLYMRNVTENGIWKIQTGIGDAIREYLNSKDFTEFHGPKFFAGSSESEVFMVDYFGKNVTLSQTAQFSKQIFAGSLERVFEFASTFRAENKMDTRHMTEFVTVDVEIAFIDSMKDIYTHISELINFVTQTVWKKYSKQLKALKAVPPLLSKKLPMITLKDLHALYFNETGKDERHNPEITIDEEEFIYKYSRQNWKSDAVFITEFPTSKMNFYDYINKNNPAVIDRVDLIFRGVEILTARRHENRYPVLLKRLKAAGKNPDEQRYIHYLENFKYGMPDHAGFGLGLERLTQKIIGFKNVKEATLFPRDAQILAP